MKVQRRGEVVSGVHEPYKAGQGICTSHLVGKWLPGNHVY